MSTADLQTVESFRGERVDGPSPLPRRFKHRFCSLWYHLRAMLPPANVCSRYRHISTHLTDDEKAFLFLRARALKSHSTLVEIGSYLGASAVCLAAGAPRRTCRLYCVDTWMNETMPEGRRDTFAEFVENTRAFSDTIVALRGRSSDAAAKVAGPIDLLFIDGDHSYEGASLDLQSWRPKVRNAGWVLMHDWRCFPGVSRAIREFLLPFALSKPTVVHNLYALRVRSRGGA